MNSCQIAMWCSWSSLLRIERIVNGSVRQKYVVRGDEHFLASSFTEKLMWHGSHKVSVLTV